MTTAERNSGKLAMMVGGNAAVLEKVRPVLEAMANRIVHIGETGTGQATKAVNQIMGAGINQAVTEALAFAKAQNLPMDKIIDVISSGASGNWFLQHRGLSMTEGNYPAGFKVVLHHKDLEICERMSENVGVNLPLATQTRLHYEQLIKDGFDGKLTEKEIMNERGYYRLYNCGNGKYIFQNKYSTVSPGSILNSSQEPPSSSKTMFPFPQ